MLDIKKDLDMANDIRAGHVPRNIGRGEPGNGNWILKKQMKTGQAFLGD